MFPVFVEIYGGVKLLIFALQIPTVLLSISRSDLYGHTVTPFQESYRQILLQDIGNI